MSTYAIGPARALADLDALLAILGATRVVLIPGLETIGQVVQSYGGNVHDFTPSDEGGGVNLEDEFIPVKHQGGVFSYFYDRSVNNHLAGTDHADFSAISGGVDAPFSVGAFCLPRLAGTQQTLLAKYDVAGTLREWQLGLSAAELINFELFDESVADADAAVSAPGQTALTLNQWSSVIATYGGEGGNPGFSGSAMSLAVYLNGAVDTGVVAGSGADDYVDMEDTATPPLIGAADDQAAPTFEFEGRIGIAFVCGKAVTAAEVGEIDRLGRALLGL